MLNKTPIRSYQAYVLILLTQGNFIRDKGVTYFLLIDQSGGAGRTRKTAIHNREETNMPEALAREYSFSKGKVKERKKKTRSIKDLGIENELVLSVHQTARVLHTSEARVRDLIRSGILKGFKLGEMKVARTEIERFLIFSVGKDFTDLQNIKDMN